MADKYEDIVAKKIALVDAYRELHSTFDLLTSFYALNYSIGSLPPDVQLYTPPTARKHVDSAVDHILSLGCTINVLPWSEKTRDKDLRGRLEQFGNAFYQWMRQSGRFDAVRSMCKFGFLYGMFAVRLVYIPMDNPEGLDDEELALLRDKMSRTFPFRVKSVHPKNILVEISDAPPTYVVETGTAKAHALQAMFPSWDMGDYAASDNVEYWEYWDANIHQVFVGDIPILSSDEEINPFGFIPYEIGYAGLGMESEDGSPQDLIVSLIYPALDTYRAEARAKTAEASFLEYNTFDRPIITAPEGTYGPIELSYQAGQIGIIPSEYKYQNLAPSHINPDFYRWLQMVQADLQQVVPSTLQGVQPKGMTSGYMWGISVGEARISFGGLKKDMEKAIGNLLRKVLVVIKDVINQPVSITGSFVEGGYITVNPNEIDYDAQLFNVVFEAETPEQKDRRINLGLLLLSRGALSWETICEEYFGRNATQERQRILVEQALASPLIKDALSFAALQDAGMKEVLALMQQGKMPSQNSGLNINPGMNPANLTGEQGMNEPRQARPQDFMRSLMRGEGGGTGELGSRNEMEGAPDVFQ